MSVTFRRTDPDQVGELADVIDGARHREPETVDGARVLLISCSKSKSPSPAPAGELYTSARFCKAAQHARRRDLAWYVLSAEHGLLLPDEWLSPYERYLPETGSEFRRAWAAWVVARLGLYVDLRGLAVEVHAGEAYIAPLAPELERAGAVVERPLAGLRQGEVLAWYSQSEADDRRPHAGSPVPVSRAWSGDIDRVIAVLADPGKALHPSLVAKEHAALDGPGLYAWFVDEPGAVDLGDGLGGRVEPGLVYVGQTGATRWPSGTRSAATLSSRIHRQHLNGDRGSSTLRRTFGAVLDAARQRALTRPELTAWMYERLRVVPCIAGDRDSLADLERQVVQALSPPLNLDHVVVDDLRRELKRLRGLGLSAR